MAEGEGWWGGWLQQSFQAVKEKSSEALEFLKRDLTEFSTVVQHDTACSIVATATAVRNKLAVEGSSETTEKVKKSLSRTTEVYDSSKARLYSLQADPATYCNEPDGPPEQFDNWLSSFSLEDKKGEISELLVNSPSIRALYTKMVPAAVAHSEFWQRYFYKVFQLDQEEARRVALKQRAEQTAHTETLDWEEEEEDDFLGASGKSTPSNNGKKGSSTDVSEDWEKDFDLDMTEEEVQLALSKIEDPGELDEDWENWD
ncbi:BSD domain-containing protein 1 [Lates japonicus]|uniref:BSD domain-containing protein 1 n=1 Tax=Lates japonicus TaxID=270547 RepID=A0AAD3RHN9_LATJO|nr:BSD domain-containing protein 1 [Lates japonicus]